MATVLAFDRLSPYSVEFQVRAHAGLGLCDPALANSAIGMVPVVYDSCYFQGSVAADGANIVFPTEQTRNLFDTSAGATMDGGWHPKYLPDTNTLRQGEMSRRGQQVIVFGWAAEAVDVFQQGGEADDTSTNPKLKSAWLAPAGDGMNYAAQCKQAILENTAGELSIVDTGSEQRFLPLSSLPHWGQTRGQGMTQNGGLSIITFLANNVAIAIGTETDGLESNLELKFGQAEEIESGSPETEEGTVYVHVRLSAFVLPVCMPIGLICGMPVDGLVVATPPAGRATY